MQVFTLIFRVWCRLFVFSYTDSLKYVEKRHFYYGVCTFVEDDALLLMGNLSYKTYDFCSLRLP